MKLEDRNVIVTGGAGFVGSRLVESLAPKNEVHVIDDLRKGQEEYLPNDTTLHTGNVLDADFVRSVLKDEAEGADVVFHLAADPDVRTSVKNPGADLRQNAVATSVVLEAACEAGVGSFVFTSSSTVYGEAPIPTPETYGPPAPESPYGASKLGSEGLCAAYAASHGMDVRVFRLANIVGERGHGVVPDFVRKLRDDPSTLEILGDGRQRKSYLHIEDCVGGILRGVEEGDEVFYNVGSEDTVSVTRIAEVVSDVMGVEPEFEYTGGRRGWKGDVPRMRLDIERLRGAGWEPSLNSEGAVRRTAEEIVEG